MTGCSGEDGFRGGRRSGSVRGKSPIQQGRFGAMALLRRGDFSVTEICFAVGYSSLGTFRSRFAELVGMPPSGYRRQATCATAAMPPCVVK